MASHIKEHALLKCRRLFPNGIRIGTEVTIKFHDSEESLMSKAVSEWESPYSMLRDGSGQSIDFHHYLTDPITGENCHVKVKNGDKGIVSYISVSSNGEPCFHVYIQRIHTEIFCTLNNFGVFDEYIEAPDEAADEASDEGTLNSLLD